MYYVVTVFLMFSISDVSRKRSIQTFDPLQKSLSQESGTPYKRVTPVKELKRIKL